RFEGTIFRFPIRNHQQCEQSPFASRSSSNGYDSLRNYMDTEYSDQARRSLIMLKNICSIDFQMKMFRVAGKVMHQNTEKKWKVSSVVDGKKVESDDGNKFKQIESYTMNITIERGPSVQK